MNLDAIIRTVLQRGFAVVDRHLGDTALARLHLDHVEAVAAADPRDTARSPSGRNTRTHLPAHHPGVDRLYLDPMLLAIASGVLEAPFKLSAFLSRTVHPGADAQALHADMTREGSAPAMLGFIYMLDDFRADNGATRFVPNSHRGASADGEIMAIAPAGSLLVYDGAILHGFAASTGDTDRRSIQGTFVVRSTPSVIDRPWQNGRDDLARFLLGSPPHAAGLIGPPQLKDAIEASWDARTAYRGVTRAGNAAFGQCYPTARVVQWFYPELEIACGDVSTGDGVECHFWNVPANGKGPKIDLTWQQFPSGSTVTKSTVLDRTTLGDSPATVERCMLLLQRVLLHLARRGLLPALPAAGPAAYQ